MKILVTGSQGFIGSYVCQELLSRGHEVVGVDNYEKYGKISRPHDEHLNFKFYEEDVRERRFFDIVLGERPEIIIAGAAKIGGISYFHKYAYDLHAANERIAANTFDAAIWLHQKEILKKIIVVSSSMVFENTDVYPTPEDEVRKCPPPSSTYGFNKLSAEYFAQGAFEQYGVPYVIVRPFNCVGVGEERALDAENEELMLSHVLPDLINKTISGQDPVHILGEGNQVRCYTNGKDIARALRMLCENDIVNDHYNISTPVATTVLELAEMVWKKINPDKPFNYISDEPFHYDVQKRVPDVSKAKESFGFEAEISLEESVDEVIKYIGAKNVR
jgi:nucleoside-diphosphate-sugar epimerase